MSDIHSKPIAERIDWLFNLAHRHGKIFRSPEAWLSRERYLSEHPTAIAVLKCMDGRINIPVATNTPTGILMPFRNLGELKSHFLSRFAAGVLRDEFGALAEKMFKHTAVLDWRSRSLELIDLD
jgi:hypothetical protein